MNGKEKTQTEKLRDEILKMGKNEIYTRYQDSLDFTDEHKHDDFLHNNKLQLIIVFTAGITAVALVASIVYFWVTKRSFTPEYLLVFVAAVGITLFLIYLGLYKSDQGELKQCNGFMGAVDDIYPGFYDFAMEHRGEKFIPAHSLFPLRSDFIEIGRPYKTDDTFITRAYVDGTKIERLGADEVEIVHARKAKESVQTPKPAKKSKPAKMPALEMKPDPKEVLVILNGKRYTRRDLEKIIRDIGLEDIKPEDITSDMLDFLVGDWDEEYLEQLATGRKRRKNIS